ncbi:MAG: mechanosensitive ion channel [Candidatus Lokiarchaeota archaeon]|nr:mechanosensitive ion channel [Candidatus Lokiarchaeota archaeon]
MMILNQFQLELVFSFIFWWVIFLSILGLIFIIYKAAMYSLKRFVGKFKLAPNVTNGIRFILRLIMVLVGFSTFASMSSDLIPGGIPGEVTVIITAAISTVFALSATSVIQNFIAGIYIILTRPFNVGDLVQINQFEGIVDEISLNHTKIRLRSGGHYYISNQTIINSKITNFTLPINEQLGVQEHIRHLKDELISREITRYAMTIELPKAAPEWTKRVLAEVADQFNVVLSQPVQFITTAYLHKVIVSVIIVSEDPELVLKQKDSIVEAVYMRLFK